MTDSSTFLVSFAEDLTDDDRAVLDRPGFRLYPRGLKVSEKWFEGRARSELHGRQWVRVQAHNSEEAKRLVTEVLGRRPEGLEAFREMISDNLRERDPRQLNQLRGAAARRMC
jgi:hypothetical protein